MFIYDSTSATKQDLRIRQQLWQNWIDMICQSFFGLIHTRQSLPSPILKLGIIFQSYLITLFCDRLINGLFVAILLTLVSLVSRHPWECFLFRSNYFRFFLAKRCISVKLIERLILRSCAYYLNMIIQGGSFDKTSINVGQMALFFESFTILAIQEY